eukprot:1902911-Prymnesium_polylepis.1
MDRWLATLQTAEGLSAAAARKGPHRLLHDHVSMLKANADALHPWWHPQHLGVLAGAVAQTQAVSDLCDRAMGPGLPARARCAEPLGGVRLPAGRVDVCEAARSATCHIQPEAQGPGRG